LQQEISGSKLKGESEMVLSAIDYRNR